MSVVDVFDALTTLRPYKRSLSAERAYRNCSQKPPAAGATRISWTSSYVSAAARDFQCSEKPRSCQAAQEFGDCADERRPSDRWVHDMRNCLGIVLGFADLLLEEMDDSDVRRDDIQQVCAAARRAMRLMAEIDPVRSEQL